MMSLLMTISIRPSVGGGGGSICGTSAQTMHKIILIASKNEMNSLKKAVVRMPQTIVCRV
jgi:hypothetical protein